MDCLVLYNFTAYMDSMAKLLISYQNDVKVLAKQGNSDKLQTLLMKKKLVEKEVSHHQLKYSCLTAENFVLILNENMSMVCSAKVLCLQNVFSRKQKRYNGCMSHYVDITIFVLLTLANMTITVLTKSRCFAVM